MSISFPGIAEIGEAEWDTLVRASPDGWVFSLHGWQAIVTGVAEWGFVERGFGLREGKRLLAVVPLHYRPTHGFTASSGWGGSGPILAPDLEPQHRERVLRAALDHALDLARADGASVVEMSGSPVTRASLDSRWGVNPFELHGFDDRSLLSQVIDLSQPEEALWAGLAQSARQAVRKAEKAGYRAAKVNWADHVDAYYSCHVETYGRTGVSPHPRAYFEGIARQTAPKGASVLLAAVTAQGEPHAFHNDARLGAGATYHTGCSRNVGRGAGLDYLLMWEAIRDAKALGFGWYDCGWVFPGSQDAKQKGLTLFKTRFGGEPHRAFRGAFRLPAREARTRAPVQEPEQGPGQEPTGTPPQALRLAARVMRALGFG